MANEARAIARSALSLAIAALFDDAGVGVFAGFCRHVVMVMQKTLGFQESLSPSKRTRESVHLI